LVDNNSDELSFLYCI